MLTVNLISSTLPDKDPYFNIWRPVSSIRYNRHFNDMSRPLLITDELCIEPIIIDALENKISRTTPRVGWLIEPPVVKPTGYDNISRYKHLYDVIYTYSEELLKLGSPFKLLRFGACWIPEKYAKVYPKPKLASIIVSWKRWTEGHNLRYQIMEFIKEQNIPIDLYGTGTDKPFADGIPGRLDPFRDYQFSIVVENCRIKDYFTDKIVDCFATGTIPIYWGSTNISEIYNKDGIIEFSSLEEVKKILLNFKYGTYENPQDKFAHIADNFNRHVLHASPDENIGLAIKRDLGL